MRIALMTAFAALLLAGCAQEVAVETPEARIERGRYLVQQVALCADCHTPRLPTGELDETRALQGAPFSVPPGAPLADFAPQLAGGPANFNEEQFVEFLQTGVRPDGTHPRPPMPPYRLNEEDAEHVAAYIRSLPRAAAQ